MSHVEQRYSTVPNYPKENKARPKQTAKFIRRIRCAADKFFSSRRQHHWWLCLTLLTPLVCAAFLIAAHCIILPQRLENADVYVYWTYNCTGYVNATTPVQAWTTVCKAGPTAKPFLEHELLSNAKECFMNMTSNGPVSGALGRFSVECMRHEGFKTEPTDPDAFGTVIFWTVFFAVCGSFSEFRCLRWAHFHVARIVNDAVGHLESCSSCSLDTPLDSSNHLPIVKWQLIHNAVRNHLVLQTILAPLLVALLVVTSTAAILLSFSWSIIALPSFLIWIHSIIGLISARILGRKAFILRELRASDSLCDAAAIKDHFEEQCKTKPFWYPICLRGF